MYSITLETRSLLTPDGIRLDADVYFPQGIGAFPVLLMRQPYGRTIASTVVYAHPRWYAQQGYIVVIQDVRGRGTSQGEFHLFAHEEEDGNLTVNWAAELPGSSGAVGMYGFSYQGMTQLYAAMGQSSALKSSTPKSSPLKTICPAMLATDLHQDWAYEGGAFCFQLNLAWAIQLAAETARRSGDSEAFAALFQASRQLPVDQPNAPALPEVLQRYAPDSFYFDWVNHPQANDPYWQTLNPDMTRLDLPMLHIGGWFDPYLRGTLKLYQQMKAQSQQPQHLWIGPWTHLPWGQQAGAVHFGQAAQTPIDRLQLRWFDQFLKGKDTGLLAESPVYCFDLGQKTWREAPTYPPAGQSQSWNLISTGLAALRTDAGQLIAPSPQDPDPEDFADWLVQDPWRPVPALGGHAVMPGGSFNRQDLDDRADVLTYTSDPLTTPLCLWGTLVLELSIQSPNPSFDLCAVLSVVQEAGVFNFSQGYRRIAQNTPGERITVILKLQATCRTIAMGECLRLSLSASSFPAYALNPGTGDNSEQTPRWQAQVMTLEVKSGHLQGSIA